MFGEKDPVLDPKLRELGQTRAGYAVGSQFVFSQHCKAARDVGILEEQIEAIAHWATADCFDALERAVLAYTDALVLEYDDVDERVVEVGPGGRITLRLKRIQKPNCSIGESAGTAPATTCSRSIITGVTRYTPLIPTAILWSSV